MIGSLSTPGVVGEPRRAAPVNLNAVLHSAVSRLLRAGIETARLDAEVLLGHALGMTRERLILALPMSLNGAQAARYEELLQRRLARAPVAYVTGQQEFWSLNFQVTPGVLVPRPETERLVEIAGTFAARLASTRRLCLLDIGTGSGAIAISLANELPQADVWATDISPAALAIARANALRNGVAGRIEFICADFFAPFTAGNGRFDLIVANPPYIPSDDIAALAPEVSHWEPRLALDGGADGLVFYRRFAAEVRSSLTPDGALILEIGAAMSAQVTELFVGAGYRSIETFQDYAGKDRVVVVRANDWSR